MNVKRFVSCLAAITLCLGMTVASVYADPADADTLKQSDEVATEPTENGMDTPKTGDVNCDGQTNAQDAAHILVYAAENAAGVYESDGLLDFAQADINGDWQINAEDAADILVLAAAAGAGDTDPEEPMTEIDISVRSLKEFEAMRDSLTLSEEDFEAYLAGVQNGTLLTREDVRSFVELVSVLYVPEMDNAEITWINHSTGVSKDTGEEFDVAYVTTEASDGEWIRFEYMLSEKDVNAVIDKAVSDPSFTGVILDTPTTNSDNSARIYAFSSEKHVSGTGDMMILYLECSGMFARAYYKTNDTASMDLQVLTESLTPIGTMSAE